MADAPRILVVDDEDQILRVLRPTLEGQGYAVLTAANGKDAMAALHDHPVAAMILDLGLPDMDGNDVIRRVRTWSAAPILILSARDMEDEKIAALDSGADDYLEKPFSVGELLARLRVLLRPVGGQGAAVFASNGASFDFRKRLVRLPGGEVKLSARESEFLRVLAERHGDVVSHRELIDAIWGGHDRADSQFVRVLAGQVRQKIEEEPSSPRIVLTVPGLGYRMA